MKPHVIRIPRRGFLQGALGTGIATLSLPGFASAATRKQTVTPVGAPHLGVALNVRDYGTAGDGTTLDTPALQRAVDRCNVLGGGEVFVPAGTYLTGSLALRSNVTLRLAKDAVLLGSPDLAQYTIAQVRWEGKWIPGYTALVHAIDAQNVALVGDGHLEGNVAVSGRPSKGNPLRRPALIECINCTGVRLEGFSTSYAHMWSIHPTCCDHVIIRHLTIRSTQTNGDGIDVDSCRHVLIDSCDIASGDDCISLKSGRGEEAYAMNRPTEDVRIVNCTLEGRGYACLGIGSETSGGIRDVVIESCRVTSVFKNAIYVKSRVGRGAFIENVTVRNLQAEKMRMGFLRIDQTNAGIQDADPVPGVEGIPLFRNLRFENIHVQDAPVLIEATEIAAAKMLDGLIVRNITGTCTKGMRIANARNVDIADIHVTGFEGPLLSIASVTGRGLNNAVPMPAPVEPSVVPAPDIPYTLR